MCQYLWWHLLGAVHNIVELICCNRESVSQSKNPAEQKYYSDIYMVNY